MPEASPPDKELMMDVKEGDMDAFRTLVDRHKTRIVNFLHSLCGDRTLSRDLTQEVFIKLFRYRGSYRPSGKFTSYLYTIARNHWYDHLRTSKKESGTVSLDTPVGQDNSDTLGSLLEDKDASEPFDNLREEERIQIMHRALQELSEKHRVVVVLSHLEQKPHSEIAKILDIPEGTVKSRKYTALKKLRKIVQKPDVREAGPYSPENIE